MLPNRLVVLEANKNAPGNDYAIGDVHGGLPAFQQWLDSLRPEVRGFCVGDLVDNKNSGAKNKALKQHTAGKYSAEGDHSLDVIKAIINHNEEAKLGLKGEVHVVRGNHEKMCFDAIVELEQYVGGTLDQAAIKLLKKGNDPVGIYSINHGNWMIDLFTKEHEEGKIFFNEKTNQVEYAADSEIKLVKDFIQNIPVMIHVKGDVENNRLPFNIVHAAAPGDDNKITFMIQNNKLNFTPEEAEFANWERDFINFMGRNKNSTLTIVGHNIVFLSDAEAIRPETNTIDLDFRAYHYGRIMALNITEGVCKWFGNLNKEAVKEDAAYDEKNISALYNEVFEKIQCYLIPQIERCEFLKAAAKCEDSAALQAVIERHTTLASVNAKKDAPNESARLLELAITHNVLSDTLLLDECMLCQNLKTLFDHGLDPLRLVEGKSILDRALYALRTVDFNEEPNLNQLYLDLIQSKLTQAVQEKDYAKIINAIESGANFFHVANDENATTIIDVAREARCLRSIIGCSTLTTRDLPQGLVIPESRDTGWNVLHEAALTAASERKFESVLDQSDIPASSKAHIPIPMLSNLLLAAAETKVNLGPLSDAQNSIFYTVIRDFYDQRDISEGKVFVTANDILDMMNVFREQFALLKVCQTGNNLMKLIEDGSLCYNSKLIDDTFMRDHVIKFENPDAHRALMQGYLYECIQMGDHEGIQAALERGADLFYVRNDGKTAFDFINDQMSIGEILELSVIEVNPTLLPQGMPLPDNSSGWSEIHLKALQVKSPAEFMKLAAEPDMSASAATTIPVRVFEAIVNHYAPSGMETTVNKCLGEFYQKHKTNNDCITVNSYDLNDITVKIAAVRKRAMLALSANRSAGTFGKTAVTKATEAQKQSDKDEILSDSLKHHK